MNSSVLLAIVEQQPAASQCRSDALLRLH